MVDRLLAFKSQLDEVLSDAFASSPSFADQLTSALQSSINARSNKPAELVAKWIDAKLRGSKGMSEADLEADLDRALVLFGYIQVRCVNVSGCVWLCLYACDCVCISLHVFVCVIVQVAGAGSWKQG